MSPDCGSERRCGGKWRGRGRGGRSLVGTARARAGEDVFPLAEVVHWVQGTAAFPPPALDRDGLHIPPPAFLPAIEDDRDAGAVSDPTPKATVQLELVPRHNQQV
jgi:hypothetical protein